jgi:hypothetical protein
MIIVASCTLILGLRLRVEEWAFLGSNFLGLLAIGGAAIFPVMLHSTFARVVHDRGCVVTVARAARGDGDPCAGIAEWEILKEVRCGQRARHEQRTVRGDVEAWEEGESDEIG